MTSRSGKGCCWYQTEIILPPKGKGVHKITNILTELSFLRDIQIGVCNISLKNTSASLSINECWGDDVGADMDTFLNTVVPEDAPYLHTIEGPDGMTAHIKASLIGSSVTIPITDGKLNMNTWQGIWLLEHRYHGGPRTLIVTVQGCIKD
ncbi:UPF0047 protein YjbQ isoform X1 [Hydra vulgaris]|uniref:UPF0047 protein YjbQ isoform X1 n=1 Tax=Hydra vulgaris TaxID=6087 RepID=UPI0001927067|nr:UPF0047 protein YjbQ [Hydra vulgaris]XP_012555537.1 UPF0047 protein YjbQ [Hydra vulgaris]XP_047127912.1 UPF0047 protein YjbQ [Hydra vulgaris]